MFTYTDDDIFRYSNLGDISPSSTTVPISSPPVPPLFERRCSKETVFCNDLTAKPIALTNINYNLSHNMPLKNVFSKEVSLVDSTDLGENLPTNKKTSDSIRLSPRSSSYDTSKHSDFESSKSITLSDETGMLSSTDSLAVIPSTITENVMPVFCSYISIQVSFY